MTANSCLDRIQGRAVVLRGDDIDTDRIVPARFLKAITFQGLETHLFEDDRLADRARGRVHPLDAPEAAGARVLVAGANFGCGSSREHAPQALSRWGIHCVIAESFAEIFFSNALTIGLPCVRLARADAEMLRRACESRPATVVRVSLAEQWADWGDGRRGATLPDSARLSLVSGQWDATGLLVAGDDDVARAASALPYVRGF
jgi:3-isopropylmalate/(R)-2-methylmalate dehydratase small subunit